MTNLPCPICKTHKLHKIWSKTHYFYGCSGYPDCAFSISEDELYFNKEDYCPDTNWNPICPICHAAMKIKHGKFGSFFGCENYPKCKGTAILKKKSDPLSNEPEFAPTHCPAIGCGGTILQRKSRFNKLFYSCSSYPNCDVIVNHIDELQSKYINHPQTAYKKVDKKKASSKSNKTTKSTKSGTKKSKATSKTPKEETGNLIPSESLSKIIGPQPVSRTMATKKLWDYIKSNNLQDPKDKRNIIPDANLKEVIGDAPISMFKLQTKLSEHLSK